MDNGFGLGCCQLVNQLGVDVPRPRPAPDVGDALVIDGDHGNLAGGLTRCAGAGKVVKAPLKGTDCIGRQMQHCNSGHQQHRSESI